MPRIDPIFWNCVPETIALEEQHIGNVERGNRGEIAGLMNPPLTRYVDYWGQQITDAEIDGAVVERPSGGKARRHGLRDIFGVSSQTIRRWFGRAATKANCVRRRVFLTTITRGPNKGKTVPTGQTVSGLQIGDLRRVCLAACLCAEEGLVRCDDEGDFVSTWQHPKMRRVQGKEIPLVWRDTFHVATLERAVKLLERMTQPAHENPVYNKHSFDYYRTWVRLKIVHPQTGQYHAADARAQGIRPGYDWDLLEVPQGGGWYVIADVTYPILGTY